MKPIPTRDWLAGKHPLPAGAVPLASDLEGTVICATPSGRWIRWHAKKRTMEDACPGAQREVIRMAVSVTGGTAMLAEKLKVSPRTVEAWRGGTKPLPIRVAEQIAWILR